MKKQTVKTVPILHGVEIDIQDFMIAMERLETWEGDGALKDMYCCTVLSPTGYTLDHHTLLPAEVLFRYLYEGYRHASRNWFGSLDENKSYGRRIIALALALEIAKDHNTEEFLIRNNNPVQFDLAK